MIGYSKLTRRIAKFLIFVLTITTVLFSIPPGTARAAGPADILNKLPESTPGNLTVNWYSAKRYIPGQEPKEDLANVAGTYFRWLENAIWPPVDKDKSNVALQSYSTSKFLKKEKKSDLTFNMDMWQPDHDYWMTINDPLATFDNNFTSIYNWTWCEVDGFIKMPDVPLTAHDKEHNNYYLIDIGMDSLQRSDIICDLEIPNNGDLSPGTFVPFRLRIKCYEPDQSKLSTQVPIVFNYQAQKYGTMSIEEYMTKKTGDIPSQNLYSKLELKDMKPFFQLDPQNYTLNLNLDDHIFGEEAYEYGYAGGTDFKPLAPGANYLEPGSGDVIVRYKRMPQLYITVGTITPPAAGTLSVAGRTSATASLAWSAPLGGPTSYDIYRQEVDVMKEFSPPNAILTISVNAPVQKVGSTSGLTFTDQGLNYGVVYAYYVAANYSAGNITLSNTVRTDSAVMQGLPSIPSNPKVELVNQTAKSDLKLSWDTSASQEGIKEYVVYRKITSAPTGPTQLSSGAWIIGGNLEFSSPVEIARTSGLSYFDSGLNNNTKCEYCVQAVDKNGVPSYISSPIAMVVKDVTAPTAPGNFKIGNVLRQGEDVQYDFSEKSGGNNALLGPKREVVLSWDPSKDNTGVVGYNIYRKGYGKDLKTYDYWEEIEHLVGSTKDNVFVDSGLKFGAYYIYCVEAIDSEGNKTRSEAHINTMKSTLSEIIIKNGSESLDPSPAFAYYNTDYTLDVPNEVGSIRLILYRTDREASILVNSVGVDGNTELKLDPGENVIPIEVRQASVTQETMEYTLTVNRANLEDLPALNMTGPGITIKEGEIYKASGSIELQNGRDWKGSVDYGDGTDEQPLKLSPDGSFTLEHRYSDNGKFKVNVTFRYLDKGMVEGSMIANIENVVPALASTSTGIKDEYTVLEGQTLTIDGMVVDPGRDDWTMAGYYADLHKPLLGTVMADKTFSWAETFYDQKPEYDMIFRVMDDDGGAWSKNFKVKVLNVAPAVQANGVPMVQRGYDFIGSGSFADPGLDQWQATVDYGDGSGVQPLNLKKDKTFDLKHVFQRIGNYTVTVRVEDQDEGSGSASFPVKVKDYVTTLEMGADISIKEGDTLDRSIPVWGFSNRVSKILIDYGDGSGEKTVSLTEYKPSKNSESGQAAQRVDPSATAAPATSAKASLIGILPLQHTYKDNGTFTVKARIVDVDGDVYEDSFKAEAANVAPTVQLAGGEIFAGDNFTCNGTITDHGDDTWTVELNPGDGSRPQKISVDPDKTFSFSHRFSMSGVYNINAAITDDDGGVGYGECRLVVKSRPHSSNSSDASLHSLSIDNSSYLYQAGGYSGIGFISECLNYIYHAAAAATATPAIRVTAEDGASIQYSNGISTWDLPQNTAVALDIGNWTIVVTAEDGVTTRTYNISVQNI